MRVMKVLWPVVSEPGPLNSFSRGNAEMTKKTTEQPLQVKIEAGRLVISIGVITLGEALVGPMSPLKRDAPHAKITDHAEFAREVVNALNDESEDGTTLVHTMLDGVAREFLENGADGVDFGD